MADYISRASGRSRSRSPSGAVGSERTKVFVAKLSYDTTVESLRAAFEAFGTIAEVRIPSDPATGGSRGFGFVSFEDEKAAATAADAMNGVELDGRAIVARKSDEARASSGKSGIAVPQPSDGGGNPYAAEVCGDWRRGQCARGASCKFRHSESPPGASGAMPPSAPLLYPGFGPMASHFAPPGFTIAPYPYGHQPQFLPQQIAYAPSGASAAGALPDGGGNPNAEEVCGDWRASRCARGTACKYRHSELPPARQQIHHYYQPQQPIYTMGYGAAVSPVDPGGNPNAEQVCGDWRRGSCQRAQCKYRHSEAPAGTLPTLDPYMAPAGYVYYH